jgi:hypothetical protein
MERGWGWFARSRIDGEDANGKVDDVGQGENADRWCAVAAWPATGKAGHDNAIVLRALPTPRGGAPCRGRRLGLQKVAIAAPVMTTRPLRGPAVGAGRGLGRGSTALAWIR